MEKADERPWLIEEGGIVNCGQGVLILRTDAPEAEQRASRKHDPNPHRGKKLFAAVRAGTGARKS